jgi:hypothetical protein
MASGGHATLVAPGDVPALAGALDAALADAPGPSTAVDRKAATEYARDWSMETLAERYVDSYARAIESYDSHRG